MSAHTKKHLIKKRSHRRSTILYIVEGAKIYAIPKQVAEKYLVKSKDTVSSDEVFASLERQLTKAGALLKGLRTREGLTQAEFSETIGVTQANLCNMENGKRPIGKSIAKRIDKVFSVHYRYFLE